MEITIIPTAPAVDHLLASPGSIPRPFPLGEHIPCLFSIFTTIIISHPCFVLPNHSAEHGVCHLLLPLAKSLQDLLIQGVILLVK